MTSFGKNPFGQDPFGHVDWGFQLLYRDLPAKWKSYDAQQGYPLKKFVLSISPIFNELYQLIEQYHTLFDSDKVRIKFLEYLANSLGLESRLLL